MNTKNNFDFTIIGRRIGDRRKSLDLRQDDLARQVNISPKHLSEIERGKSGIGMGTLIEIAKVLNVSTDYLLLGKDSAGSLNSDLHNLTSRQRYYLENIIKYFVKVCNENEDFDNGNDK